DAVAQPHRVAPAVPVVEIADHADALRIGRPDREGDAEHAVMLAPMRAHHGIALVMRAFGEEMEVEIAQDRRKGIDVIELDDAEIAFGAQPIAEAWPPPEDARPQPFLMEARQLAGEFAARRIHHPHPMRPGQEDADAEIAAGDMHAEKGEGVAVARLEDGTRAGAKRDHDRPPRKPARRRAGSPPRPGAAPARSRPRRAPSPG